MADRRSGLWKGLETSLFVSKDAESITDLSIEEFMGILASTGKPADPKAFR